jgi:hypothetical protein
MLKICCEYEYDLTRELFFLADFQELSRAHNDGILMSISFRDEKDIEGLKQSPYSMFNRDKKAMDEILDPLVTGGQVQKIPLGTISSAFSPAFVV